MPVIAYSEFMTHIASHGFVAVGVWKLVFILCIMTFFKNE